MDKDRIGDFSKSEIQALVHGYRSMIKEFLALTEVFPESGDLVNSHYWHARLPRSSSFIDSSKIPPSIPRLCIQALIDRVQYLIDVRPKSVAGTRAITEINLPKLSRSGIITFFDEDYFNDLFNRDIGSQEWLPLSTCRSLEKEWVVSVPDKLSIKGYQEEINDGDFLHTREFWFVGELD